MIDGMKQDGGRPVDTRQTLRAAKAVLRDRTPLCTDCGRTCGHACCLPDETGRGGMLLFPTEAEEYEPLPRSFHIAPAPEMPEGLLLTCEGRCDRRMRPLSCMLFPLLPREKEGRVRAVRDRRGFYVCPLLESGVGGLSPDFVRAVTEAGEILYTDPAHRAFLEALHRQLDAWKDLLG